MKRDLAPVAMLLSRRLTRRATVSAGGAALALGAIGQANAEDAKATADHEPQWLFVQ